MGKHAEAEIEHRLILAAMEEKRGALHSIPLQRRKYLASCLLEQGKSAEAILELEFIKSAVEHDPSLKGITDPDFARLLERARQAFAASDGA